MFLKVSTPSIVFVCIPKIFNVYQAKDGVSQYWQWLFSKEDLGVLFFGRVERSGDFIGDELAEL